MTIPCERFELIIIDPSGRCFNCRKFDKRDHDIAAAVRADERQQWATEKAALEAERATFYEAYRRSCDVESKEALMRAEQAEAALAQMTAKVEPWQPMETAPTDGSLMLVWAPEYGGLPSMYSLCAYHPDAGFCIDELRTPRYWQPLPPSPQISHEEAKS